MKTSKNSDLYVPKSISKEKLFLLSMIILVSFAIISCSKNTVSESVLENSASVSQSASSNYDEKFTKLMENKNTSFDDKEKIISIINQIPISDEVKKINVEFPKDDSNKSLIINLKSTREINDYVGPISVRAVDYQSIFIFYLVQDLDSITWNIDNKTKIDISRKDFDNNTNSTPITKDRDDTDLKLDFVSMVDSASSYSRERENVRSSYKNNKEESANNAIKKVDFNTFMTENNSFNADPTWYLIDGYNDDKVCLSNGKAIFIFNIKDKKLENSIIIDDGKMSTSIQGDVCRITTISKDFKTIYVHEFGSTKLDYWYKYNVEKNELTKITGVLPTIEGMNPSMNLVPRYKLTKGKFSLESTKDKKNLVLVNNETNEKYMLFNN